MDYYNSDTLLLLNTCLLLLTTIAIKCHYMKHRLKPKKCITILIT